MTFETILTPERVDQHTRDGFWVNRTITDYLDEAAATTPDKTAFIDPRRQITYAELRREVDRCAHGLLELGVRPGDVASFPLPHGIECVVLPSAATRIGANVRRSDRLQGCRHYHRHLPRCAHVRWRRDHDRWSRR